MKYPLPTKSILMLALSGSILCQTTAAQSDADPYSKKGAAAHADASTEPVKINDIMISCTCEVFSAPLSLAAAWQREQIADGELYKRLVDGLKTESITQEILNVSRSTQYQKVDYESIVEHPYPTEYASQPIAVSGGPESLTPHTSDAAGDESRKASASDKTARKDGTMLSISHGGLPTPVFPVNFEVKNLGETLQIEAGIENQLVRLQIAFEQTLHAGEACYGQGISQTTMPEMETRRLQTQVTVPVGKPILLGTLNRPGNSKADPDSSSRISYAYVTATLVRP